jgi:hypothetical protein
MAITNPPVVANKIQSTGANETGADLMVMSSSGKECGQLIVEAATVV